MSFDYSPLAAKAVTLVEKFGRSITVVKYSTAIDDTSKPWRGTADPRVGATEVATSGLSVEPSSATQLGIMTVTGDMAQRLEAIFLVAAGTTDLSGFNEIRDGNTLWAVEFSEKLAPGDTTLLYFFGVRR